MIQDVLLTPLKRIFNPKGDIFHAMKNSSDGYAGFGEAYFSAVHYGVTKGWKRHEVATLNLVVIYGSIKFVLFDDRLDSLSNGEFYSVNIDETNRYRLTIPPGIWVAFNGMSDPSNLLMNISNIEHDPSESSNCELNAIDFKWI